MFGGGGFRRPRPRVADPLAVPNPAARGGDTRGIALPPPSGLNPSNVLPVDALVL